MGELLEELKKATLEEENKRLKEQIDFFNAIGYTVAKTSYNEVVNENSFLKKEIEELKLQIKKMRCCGNCNKLAFIVSPLFSCCCKLDNHKTELKCHCEKWQQAD